MTIKREDIDRHLIDISDVVSGRRLPPVHPGEILRDKFLVPMGISVYALAGAIKVPNDVDELASRDFRLDGVEEADELLMVMALHIAADNRAVEDVQYGEEGGRAVPFVVVGHGSGTALLHGQVMRPPDLADAFLLTFACKEKRKFERHHRPKPRNHSAWAM